MSRFDLPIELPDDLIALVVENALRAGRIAQSSFSEQDKWDSTAFGAVLWRLTWNHVEDALHEVGVHVWFEENSLRFKLGDYTCAMYSGGHDVTWDIRRYEFTRTAKRVEATNPAQGRLFELRHVDPQPLANPDAFKSLTFVYCGDPMLGLAALYLGAPVCDVSDYRWGWVSCLYRHDGSGPLGAGEQLPVFPNFTDQPPGDIEVEPVKEQTPHEEGGTGS
jgi:hypothetical protein